MGLDLRHVQERAFSMSSAKGFWGDNPDIPGKLMLICCEVAEAMEEYRKPGVSLSETYYGENGKPEGFGVELADVVIRVADLAEKLNIDLSALVQEKMDFNATRPFKHGKIC